MNIKNIGGKNMDRITQSMIDSFKSNQSLNIDDDSELFEYFVN